MVSFIVSFIVSFPRYPTGGVFGLFVALTGERMPGGAVAMAEGNALGKGPVIFHLFDSGIEYIRGQAAGEQTSIHCRQGWSLHVLPCASVCCVCLLTLSLSVCLCVCLFVHLSVCLTVIAS